MDWCSDSMGSTDANAASRAAARKDYADADSPVLPHKVTEVARPWTKQPIQAKKCGLPPMSPIAGCNGLKPGGATHLASRQHHHHMRVNESRSPQQRWSSPIVQRKQSLHIMAHSSSSSTESDDEFQLPPPGVPVSRRNDPGLVECELFKALLPHEREEVMKALYPHDCEAGFDVVEQGENGTSMFILGVGKCACKMDDAEISVLNPGAFFGEFSPDVEDKIHDDKFKGAKDSEPFENQGCQVFERFAEETCQPQVVSLEKITVYELYEEDARRIIRPNREAWKILCSNIIISSTFPMDQCA